MVFITVVINYLDRTNMLIAAAALKDELGIDAIQMGYIFSAFGWTCSLPQIPGGIVTDKVKSRILYPIIIGLWSITILLQGMVSTFAALVGLREIMGVFEAPSYPINNLIVTRWFPENERASLISTSTTG